jgi:hypothetical protein
MKGTVLNFLKNGQTIFWIVCCILFIVLVEIGWFPIPFGEAIPFNKYTTAALVIVSSLAVTAVWCYKYLLVPAIKDGKKHFPKRGWGGTFQGIFWATIAFNLYVLHVYTQALIQINDHGYHGIIYSNEIIKSVFAKSLPYIGWWAGPFFYECHIIIYVLAFTAMDIIISRCTSDAADKRKFTDVVVYVDIPMVSALCIGTFVIRPVMGSIGFYNFEAGMVAFQLTAGSFSVIGLDLVEKLRANELAALLPPAATWLDASCDITHPEDILTNHMNRVRGDAAEGLFQYLAWRHWHARVIRHSDAPRTDAMLEWPGIHEAGRLPVQVKSVDHLSSGTFYFRPHEIRGWYLIRPIFVLCERAAARAWWFDMALYRLPVGYEPFSLPLSERRPISRRTRAAIQRVAYRRNNASLLESSKPPLKEASLLNAARLLGAISEIQADIDKADGLDRDVKALALARVIHSAHHQLSRGATMLLLEQLADRVLSPKLGGRSHSFAAITSLLLSGDGLPQSDDLAKTLESAAAFAILSGDFGHAEFGLIAAARAAELRLRPFQEDVYELADCAPEGSRTPWFRRTAAALRHWHPATRPVSALFGKKALAGAILRPSDPGLAILSRKREAELVVDRIIRRGPVGISDDEFRLVDQLTRMQADHYLWYQVRLSP